MMKLQRRAALLLAVLIAATGCKNSAVLSQSEAPSSSEAPPSSASAPAVLPLPGMQSLVVAPAESEQTAQELLQSLQEALPDETKNAISPYLK